MKSLYVHAEWDDEAEVWVASSDAIPGLSTEAETYETLIAKLRVIIPELLELNGGVSASRVSFELLTRRFDYAHA